MDQNKNLAQLESLVDYLKTELMELNDLLIKVGFDDGIQTLKASATQLLEGL